MISVSNVIKPSVSIKVEKIEGKPFSFSFNSIDNTVYSIEVSQDLNTWKQIDTINRTREKVIHTKFLPCVHLQASSITHRRLSVHQFVARRNT